MSDETKDAPPALSGRLHAGIHNVGEYIVETAAEVGETAKDFVHEIKDDITQIKDEVKHLHIDIAKTPKGKGSMLGEKMETLRKLSPTKEDVINSVNKVKALWRTRKSMMSDGGEDGGYSSSEDEEESWEAVLLMPIEKILADYGHRKWKDAPVNLLRGLPIHKLRQIPITHTRRLYLILTGPGYALFSHLLNWAIAAGIFFMYFLLVGFGTLVYASAVFTGILPRPGLRTWEDAAKLEFEALKIFLRLDWEACLDYRVRQPRIDELVSTADKEKKKHILGQVVSTVLDNIRADVTGSQRYMQEYETISLGSVAVGATLYSLFVVITFMTTAMDFREMNTKYFDGLAIILPFLLAEELGVVLARVTLVIKWFSVFLHENTVVQMLVVDKSDDEASRSEFLNDARSMCKNIGVGAWDMTGIASAMTAVWTIFFLYQSYYVDLKSQGLEPGPAGLADTMFWSMVLYSITVIGLCYLPFTTWFGGAQMTGDDKYMAMLKSCQTFLVMHRLSTVQNELSVALRKEKAFRDGVPVGQHVSSEEKRILHSFRAGILKTLDKVDFVSFFLYTVSLALVDFEAHDGENAYYKASVKRLRHRANYMHCAKLEIPIDKLQDVEIALFAAQAEKDMDGIGGGIELTTETDDDVDKKKQRSDPHSRAIKTQGDLIESMYDVDVLDVTVGDSFVDKQVYDLRQVLENPSVRDVAVFRNPYTNQLVLGLELKMMERKDKRKVTTVFASIYLLAVTVVGTGGVDRYEIGNGPIFLRAAGLEKKTLKLEGVDVLFEKVASKVFSRYIKRCALAMAHEQELFNDADDFLKGALPAPPPPPLSKRPSMTRNTGSASHLDASEYRAANTVTASPVVDRTASGRIKHAAQLNQTDTRIQSASSLTRVFNAAATRTTASGSALPLHES
ncbi:Aste57867_255 [Aphanomyces stellatus]|uniref:Aste57867_255 protein n=1 Tax=Aphanomyces stellatus TaxID=120398 RepID=A0A485K373_9STRA|nr:hypothetical protein As57867_000255 [Aphanomyces stellatus]VFT77481.1 Aste57867_255 [Aphanomyces stellatus]